MDPHAVRDPVRSPQRWNRYQYALGNPYKYVDPDGRVAEIVLDVGFIVYDVVDIARSVSKGEGVSTEQAVALGGDVLGAVVPFFSGGGKLASKVLFAADKAGDGGRMATRVALNLKTKAAARDAIAKMGLNSVQARKANSTIKRATTSSAIDIGTKGDAVVIQISRPGSDGKQIVQTVVAPDGSKRVTQFGVDATGNVVHVDKKLGDVEELIDIAP